MSEQFDSPTSEIPPHAREGLELTKTGLFDDYLNSYAPVQMAISSYIGLLEGGGDREGRLMQCQFALEAMPQHYVEYLKQRHTEPGLISWIDRNVAEHQSQVSEVDALIDEVVASRAIFEKMAQGSATKEEVLAVKKILDELQEKVVGK